MPLALRYAAASHVGLIRTNNEDSAYAAPYLLALADGMGGHAAGEIASQLMIESVSHIPVPTPGDDLNEMLLAAVTDGNLRIAHTIELNPDTAGMGCTLDAFLFRDTELAICHVGDSRGYRFRDGELEQLTRDDTYVQSLVDEGRLDPADVSSHPNRSWILKALTGEPVEPTFLNLTVQEGDRYILCSDGLSDPVTRDTMQEVLYTENLHAAAERLIDLALRSGGPDNVTVVLGEVVSISDEAAAALSQAVPLAVGAIAPEPGGGSHRPDTAAGRAVGMQLVHQPEGESGNADNAAGRDLEADAGDGAGGEDAAGIGAGDVPGVSAVDGAGIGAGDATGHPSDGTPADSTAGSDSTSRPNRHRLPIIIGIVVFVLALAAGGIVYVVKGQLDKRFYVGVSEQENILIYQGTEEPILGIQLHTVYRQTCLTAEGNLSLYNSDSAAPTGCMPFSLSDLQPAARTSVDSLPAGSYNDIQAQVERLAKQVLPPCVERQTSTTDGSSGAAASSTTSAGGTNTGSSSNNNTGSSAASTASNNPGDLTTPGKSCRAVTSS